MPPTVSLSLPTLQWHFRLLQQLYSTDRLESLVRSAGMELGPDGEVTSSAVHEVDEYLHMVGQCLGPIAMVNARIQLARRLQEAKAEPTDSAADSPEAG